MGHNIGLETVGEATEASKLVSMDSRHDVYHSSGVKMLRLVAAPAVGDGQTSTVMKRIITSKVGGLVPVIIYFRLLHFDVMSSVMNKDR